MPSDPISTIDSTHDLRDFIYDALEPLLAAHGDGLSTNGDIITVAVGGTEYIVVITKRESES